MYSTQARRASRNSIVIADENNEKLQVINLDKEAKNKSASKSRSPSGNNRNNIKEGRQRSQSTSSRDRDRDRGEDKMAAAVDMSAPYKGVHRVHTWDESVEENYRFQCAGFRDLFDFEHSMNNPQEKIDRWPHNGFIKKLVRKDGCFMYFNKSRECIDKEVHKVKLYKY